MFLAPSDFNATVRQATRNMVTDSNNTLLFTVENYAIEMVKSFLRYRYDVNAIFNYQVQDFQTNKAFTTGQYVRNDNLTYRVIQDAPEGSDILDDSYFVEDEPRNTLILGMVVDIATARLYNRTNITNEASTKAADDAVKTLKMIGRGEMNLDLPVIAIDQRTGSTETWHVKSMPKGDNNW